MWMDLESVIQSELSQKKKNKYCISTHIYGIQKNGTDEPICKAGIETQMQKHVDTEGKEGGTNWEISTDIYTLPYVKLIASENLLYSTGSSARCSVNQMCEMGALGGMSKREGIYIYIYIHVADSLCCTAEINTIL